MKVLIVDDNEELCKNLADILALKTNYTVEIAHNGSRAIEAVKKTEFDLVLIDYKMSDINGLEALKRIKTINPRTNIIMITAFANDGGSLNNAKFEIMQKPINVDELLIKLEKIANESTVI